MYKPFSREGSRFGSIANIALETTEFVFIVNIVTRQTKAKAAVKNPEPTVYIMMRLTIELVLLENTPDE